VKVTQLNWNSIIALIESLRESQEPDREELKRIISRCSELLQPLAEPLLLDSALTKMLAGSREEAYSDWLAWCLERLEPARALSVLGINEGTTEFRRDGEFEIKREHWVASGRKGSSGRLDLRLLVDGREIADIEVKLGDADKADVDKHEGYAKSGTGARVLLATDGSLLSYGGFELRKWGDICVALRHEARLLLKQSESGRNVLTAGWLLEFVATVEENLLKVPGPVFRAICNHHEARIFGKSGREIEHLKNWIDSAGDRLQMAEDRGTTEAELILEYWVTGTDGMDPAPLRETAS